MKRNQRLVLAGALVLLLIVACVVGFVLTFPEPAPPGREPTEPWAYRVTKHVLLWSQAVGIPVAIVLFFVEKRRERSEREYGTYNSLDEKYLEYLKVCLAHPNLDVFDVAREGEHTRAVTREEEIIYTMLIAIFERAYLLYEDKSEKVRTQQWAGWDRYMDAWAARPKFRAAWERLGQQFEMRFCADIDRRISNAPTSEIQQHSEPPAGD